MLTFLSLQRAKPGHKADAVAQPYNNVERLLKFRLARAKMQLDELRRTFQNVTPNEFQWPFRETRASDSSAT